MKRDISAAEARALLKYDPDTGSFFWRVRRGAMKAGDPAGHIAFFSKKGSRYLMIRIGRLYMAHRLAWLVMTGAYPDEHIDHENGNSLDNRFVNLREATRSQNMQNKRICRNNQSGFKGVSWDRINQKWVARIREPQGCYRNLGRYQDAERAHAAYCDAAREMFGEFARAS